MSAFVYANIDDLLKDEQPRFSIIEEFAALNPNRKLQLCEHLFSQGRSVYQRTAKILWPQAAMKDILKLERFLILLKNTAH